jgi:hypothetical protein
MIGTIMEPKDWILLAESVLTSLAIIVGGIWAYFHYFRGRVYKSRLELNVAASLKAQSTADYILVKVALKNVGLSKVDLSQEGTAIQILACRPLSNLSFISSAKIEETATFQVFENHRWIESGELITERHLFAAPKNYSPAYTVKLRVVARKVSWTANDIVVTPDPHESPNERG